MRRFGTEVVEWLSSPFLKRPWCGVRNECVSKKNALRSGVGESGQYLSGTSSRGACYTTAR